MAWAVVGKSFSSVTFSLALPARSFLVAVSFGILLTVQTCKRVLHPSNERGKQYCTYNEEETMVPRIVLQPFGVVLLLFGPQAPMRLHQPTLVSSWIAGHMHSLITSRVLNDDES